MTDVRRRRRGSGGDGAPVVPDAEFTSYYGRPVLKAAPWQDDIPAYLFLGGLAGGSALLAAGADLTDRPALRRAGRLSAFVAVSLSFVALVHDLGRPSRFVNMLRTVKLTSPMSVGTWILAGFGPLAGLAAAAELRGLLPRRLGWLARLLRLAGRPAGLGAAVLAPPVASYTAVLLADTATPAWHEAYRELPLVFVGSAAAASGGLGMVAAPTAQASPARRLAVLGAVGELTAERAMESSMGITAETLHQGRAGRLLRLSRTLTAGGALAAGAVEAATLSGRAGPIARAASAVAGGALLVGSVATRFAIYDAGQESARDPKYAVLPQRERRDRNGGRPTQVLGPERLTR